MKTISRLIILFIVAALLYTTAMYGYVWMNLRPVAALTAPLAATSLAVRPQVHVLHAVQSARRAQAKDDAYEGLEIDLLRAEGKLKAAPHAAGRATDLEFIFSALAHPEQKTFWLRTNTVLSQEDINYLKDLAQKYHIHPRRLLFEVEEAGETADLLQANGLPLLLRLPAGFHQDNGQAPIRTDINARLEELIRRYQPLAISAPADQYPYVKTYLPQYPKALYETSTVRPSLKKYFLARALQADPTVLLWMTDEYTFLPF